MTLPSDSSSVVHLNIGGKKFCTTVDTLTHREPDSMLAAMFSGRHSPVLEDPKKLDIKLLNKHRVQFRTDSNLIMELQPTSQVTNRSQFEARGKKFCTTVDTLTHREPDSMLAAMFSGRHTLCEDPKKGYVFVDRDGEHFRHILNWLRDGVVPVLKDNDYTELLREAEYYQLIGLMDGINAVLNKRKEDDELNTELTRIDIIKCIQSDRVRFRGVNLSGLDLSKLDLSNVDFSYACLKNVFFSRANLQCAKFRGRCEFNGANLHGALLAGANLKSANLQAIKLIIKAQSPSTLIQAVINAKLFASAPYTLSAVQVFSLVSDIGNLGLFAKW
ncbi:FH protein interacting protein FIP2 [Morella rubra]|uniref:FH protein interacting protein FIP2 n=1 Tax=Morella rubra TaxID=262757 RepID=A0A6A1WHM8_9ROSI|nr:FH protein interacting protein FIP2 [Morella rubra]